MNPTNPEPSAPFALPVYLYDISGECVVRDQSGKLVASHLSVEQARYLVDSLNSHAALVAAASAVLQRYQRTPEETRAKFPIVATEFDALEVALRQAGESK